MKCDQVIVFGHGAIQANLEWMSPYWHGHNAPLHIVSPTDDPIVSDWNNHHFGGSCWNGPELLHRTYSGMKLAINLPGDFFIFHEYDSVAIRPDLIQPKLGFQSIKRHEPVSGFTCDWVPSFPWAVDRATLTKLIYAYRSKPDIYEGGYSDRWIGALLQYTQVPWTAFSPGDVVVGDVHESTLAKIKAGIKDGCGIFHGIKKKWELDFIVDESNRVVKSQKTFFTYA